ncbi:hypothetical protein [Inquilinus sp. CAU 1745]|uniref:hypothetical protein n=1 Tax=Inquilinus sp. CAU 1745 TaxID=3140369 RepID=UPI00325BB570
MVWLINIIVGGFGGCLPTLSRTAATFAAAPETPIPGVGYLFGLLLFFLVGMGISFALNHKRDARQALLLGIAAPGIITNIVMGVNDTGSLSAEAFSTLAGQAYAQPAEQGRVMLYQPPDAVWMTIDSRLDNHGYTGWTGLHDQRISVFAMVDGEEYLVGYAQTEGPTEILIPDAATALVFRTDGDVTTEVPLSPHGPARSLMPPRLVLQSTVSPAGGDFAWALGAKRQGRISAMSAGFADPQ